MIRSLITILAATLVAVSVFAGEQKTPPKKDRASAAGSEAPAPQDSPLVRAAKAAQKARERKASTGTVITDESVKKSTGRITVLSEPVAPAAPARPEDAGAALAGMKKERTDAAAQAEQARLEIETLEKEIARLEKELDSIEESYYDESDVELRADLSQRNFARTKADLAAAREKLAEARTRHEALSRASSNVIKR
ncbi:MAG: hypothetical protein ABR517_00055 [Thermoanaerobaculia bacterium]